MTYEEHHRVAEVSANALAARASRTQLTRSINRLSWIVMGLALVQAAMSILLMLAWLMISRLSN